MGEIWIRGIESIAVKLNMSDNMLRMLIRSDPTLPVFRLGNAPNSTWHAIPSQLEQWAIAKAAEGMEKKAAEMFNHKLST